MYTPHTTSLIRMILDNLLTSFANHPVDSITEIGYVAWFYVLVIEMKCFVTIMLIGALRWYIVCCPNYKFFP